MAARDLIVERFWYPAGSELVLDSGFLPDPRERIFASFNEAVRTFDKLAQHHCLILLGEPGSGKTTALRNASHGGNQFWFDLGGHNDESALAAKIGEVDERQICGSVLTFDSFDESLLRIDAVERILARILVPAAASGARIRVISRSAVRPALLERDLALAGHTPLVYTLAPLRRRDTAALAEASGEDPIRFMEEVFLRGAAAFATQPTTVELLLSIYKKDRQLPARKEEIYHRGCRELVREPSRSRTTPKLRPKYEATERLAVASRIAAMMTFGRYSSIARASASSRGDLILEHVVLRGGSELFENGAVQITTDAIHETLDSALFSSAIDDSLAFKHRTHQEYLTALFLNKRGFSAEQAIQLLTFFGEERRLIPQLREVAIWLAILNPEFRRELMKIDLGTVMSGGLEYETNAAKAFFVTELFKELSTGSMESADLDSRAYRAVLHPGIELQLAPVIRNQKDKFDARRTAIVIAESLEMHGCIESLLFVALDRSDTFELRQFAAHAVRALGSDHAIKRLRALLEEDATDRYDDLFGIALSALWPRFLTVAELFSLLRPGSPTYFGGEYWRFLNQNLIPSLSDEHLAEALRWAARQEASWDMPIRTRMVLRSVLEKGWERVQKNTTLRADFAKAAMARLDHHDDIFASEHDVRERRTLTETERRKLIDLLFREALYSGDFGESLFHASIAQPEDLVWACSGAQEEANRKVRKRFLSLVRALSLPYLLRQSETQREALLDLVLRNRRARAFVRDRVGPIKRRSRLAFTMQREYRDALAFETSIERALKAQIRPFDRDEQLRVAFALHDRGDVQAWEVACRALLADPATGRSDQLDSDVASSKGFKELAAGIKTSVEDVAVAHLKNPPRAEPTLALAALDVLFVAERKLLDALPEEAWSINADALVHSSVRDADPARKRWETLLVLAHSKQPEAVRKSIVGRVRSRARDDGYLGFLPHYTFLRDAQLDREISDVLKQPDIAPETFGHGLRCLFDRNETEAYELGVQFLRDPSRRAAARAYLLLYVPRKAWHLMRQLAFEESSVTQEVLHALARRHEHQIPAFTAALSAGDAVFLHGLCEPGSLRDAILGDLIRRGTRESLKAVREIAETEEEDVRARILRHAEQVFIEKSWVPVSPTELLALADERSRRIVRNGDDLLEIVVEALDSIQKDLHGTTAEVAWLWDERRGASASDRYTPKDEAELSNYVARGLRNRLGKVGVVVNREVQIRRSDESDIYVETAERADGREVSARVVIETKGCWHRELWSAMETQLRDRYLTGDSRHGIFLVGWYLCDEWDKNDYRRSDTPRRNIEGVKTQLDDQAKRFSSAETKLRAYVLDVRRSR